MCLVLKSGCANASASSPRHQLRAAQFVAGLLTACAMALSACSAQETLKSETEAKARKAFAQLPLAFEANEGQSDPSVKFLARGPGYSVLLTPDQALLIMSRQVVEEQTAAGKRMARESNMLRMRLAGASAHPAELTPQDALASHSNYLTGNDAGAWRTNIAQYGKVRQNSVYPGIDLIYYGTQCKLEYDFVVAPGANPGQIVLEFDGADKLSLSADGELLLAFSDGVLRQHKPVVYQEENGKRKDIGGKYVLLGEHRAGFQVNAYDAGKTLVIDPVLTYSTMLGDSPADTYHSGDDAGRAIAVDADGNAYVVGYTNSVSFPVTTGQTSLNKVGEPNITLPAPRAGHLPLTYDAFVAKFNASGTALTFATFLGGGSNDYGYGVAIDSVRNVYITGQTLSNNFPVLNAVQATNSGNGDAFLTKIDSGGDGIVFSTYLGGAGADIGNGVTVDKSGNVYVVGTTGSANYQRAHSIQTVYGGGASDAFITKIDSTGSFLIYSTYLGGSGADTATAVATDNSGSAYVTGSTASNDFPTSNAYQLALGGGSDAYMTKINATGTLLIDSTYLGGTGNDSGAGIAVDVDGNVYVAGTTSSDNFPTATAINLPMPNPDGLTNIQSARAGASDAFVTKFNNLGSALVYSTYLGGAGADTATGICVDGNGAAYVVGTTASPDFPTAPLSTLQTGLSGGVDGFLAKFNPTGAPFVYSTYLGSQADDGALGVAAGAAGNAYVSGFCMDGFTTTVGAFQTVPGYNFPAPNNVGNDINGFEAAAPNIAQGDAYLCKIGDTSPLITSSRVAFGTPGALFQYTITATNTGSTTTYNASGLPPNLSVNLSTGVIGGIPAPGSAGTYLATVFATNPAGTGAKNVRIIVSGGKPVISGATTASGSVNKVFTYQINASNGATQYIAQNLPPGLTVDNLTGLISGMPLTPSASNVTLYAANDFGQSDPFTVLLTINSLAPVITSPATVSGYLNEPFTYMIAATNNPQAYQTLPNPPYPGLTLDTATGIITGTPTAVGPAAVVLSATNAGGVGTKSLALTITVRPPPEIVSPLTATAVRGAFFSYTISATNNPLIYSCSPVPAGLSFDNTTGVLSGAVTAAAGLANLTISASNSGGTTPQTLALTISEPAQPVINSPASPTIVRGVPFQYTLTATNNPLSFQQGAGALPAGIAFTGAGQTSTSNPSTWNLVSGITTAAAGDYVVAFQAFNINAALPSLATPITFSVVNPSPPIITSPSAATGTIGVPFSYTITTANFADSYSVANALPAGLSFSGKVISGTPTGAVIASLVLTASNSADATATSSQGLTITINAPVPPTITSNPLTANGLDGSFFAFPVTATGTTPLTYGAAGFASGSTLKIDPATGIISGMLNSNDVGVTNITLTATNAVSTTTATLVLTVSATPPVITNDLILPDAAVGTLYNFPLQASGTTPIVFTSLDPLPTGLNVVNSPTPAITGIPTSGAVGTTTFRMKAANSVYFDTKLMTLTVSPQSPHITLNPAVATGVQGQPFSYVVGLGGSQPITLTATGLPDGLSLAGNTIAGTPVASAVGTNTVTLTATNGSADQDVAYLQIAISSASPEFISDLNPSAYVSAPFTYKMLASGVAPIVFTTGPLPSWLSFDGVDTLSGTPPSAGQSFVSLTATNAFGAANVELTISASLAAPTITSATQAAAEILRPFSFTLAATGSLPIAFDVSGLPPGLSFNGNTISGAPTAEGSYLVTITATNAVDATPGSLTITVGPAPALITSPLAVSGSVGIPLTYKIVASGSAPITYSATNLPAGFTFSGDTISGTPASQDTLTATISAQNPYGPADTHTLTITIGERDNDSDGDGFTDELEVALGTNPNDAASTPFNGQPAGTNEVLNITSMNIKLVFNSAQKDSVAIRGNLPLAADAALAGQDAILVAGGVVEHFPLAANGSGTAADGGKLQLKTSGKGGASFNVKLAKGSFAATLASSGLLGDANYRGVSRRVSVYLLVNQTVYRSFKLLSWTAKQGKTGTAKQASPGN